MTDKNYQVLNSNGEEVKIVKSLSIAKKMANSEGGSVICDGECVYKAEIPEKPTEKVVEAERSVEAEKTTLYRIRVLMNVRAEPSILSEKIGLLNPGTDVSVKVLKDDWLHLTDGGFVLYDSGKNAEMLCGE